MNDPLELSLQTAENLQSRMKSLATMMSRTAEALQRGESVELQHLSNEITAVQDQIQQVSRKLQEHPLLADQERYATKTSDIISACHSINLRQKAVDQLKRLQLVNSFEPNDQEAFRQMVDKATGLIQHLTTGSSEDRQQAVLAVTGDDSAYRALYEFIQRPEELSDERWLSNQQRITEAFGKNVAMAVMRGRAR